MALPIINAAVYELTIPSTKKKIKYRPFLVKEEKALLIAQQSEDEKVMFNTVKEIIKSCTLDKVEVDKLSLFDIEYIFLQLRTKSVGEISTLVFSCKNCNDPKAKVQLEIDLSKIEVKHSEEHKTDIDLFGDIGVRMKYPSLSIAGRMGKGETSVDDIFEVITECIDCIYDGDDIYPAKDSTKQELEDFINNLTQEQFGKIQKFFETMPVLQHEVEFDCPVCSFHHKHTLKGLENFF